MLVSGHEIAWDDIRRAVDSQIPVPRAEGESTAVLAELESLKQRLGLLQRAGKVAQHPAAQYDEEV
jgi:hypothetical protein